MFLRSTKHESIRNKIAVTLQTFKFCKLRFFLIDIMLDKKFEYTCNEWSLFLFKVSLTAISIATSRAILPPRYPMTTLWMQ